MNGAIWVIGEPALGGLAHISEEVATAARLLGAERRVTLGANRIVVRQAARAQEMVN